MLLQFAVAFAGLTTLATATPVIPVDSVNRRQGTPTASLEEPCAKVSSILLDYDKDGPIPTTVPAPLALECLLTIPLNVTSAKAILYELPIYLNWQSTLDVLKNPPAEYVEKIQSGVDLLAGLEDIEAQIDNGNITNEYSFGWELYELFSFAHDGHLNYILDVVGDVFSFSRPVPLVSVSEDGNKLPSVFVYSDVLGLSFKNISYTPSPIIKINDYEATEFLEWVSQQGALQDRDALYNNLFYNLAQTSLTTSGTGTGTFTGGGRGRYRPVSANTTFEFANGTVRVIDNVAKPILSFRNVTSGADLRAKLVYDEGSVKKTSPPETFNPIPRDNVAPDQIAAVPPGYPAPVVAGPANLINGYYINEPGYEDVAVLSVPNFVTSSYAELPFQLASKTFLAKAWSEGKTKLIVDLQANGGGTILQGYDLFKQLFPTLDPYGASRYRYNAAVDLVGQAFSALADQYPHDAGKTNSTLRAIQSSFFDYHEDTTADGKPFESWAQKVGPITTNGHQYTSLIRWNLTDIYIPSQAGINVTGFSNLTRWKPDDIVLVTDGYCASTCSIFAELMTQQGGVKTIAFGGRSNAERIQAVGGVKGSNVYDWLLIRSLARIAKSLNQTAQNSILSEYDSGKALGRSFSNGINVRDAVRLGDDSGIALQFKYEEADCRLYYTPEMTVNAGAIWKAAADAQWRIPSKCIGNGGYSKRAAQGKTTKLSPGLGQTHGINAASQLAAIEGTFSLQTEYQHGAAGGFMQP